MNHLHTNKLASETSPYLLQHAHNPVNWYPWGNEALELAKREDKPILVSIGYSACHWCHVMERESFENEETATIMNENFINIKIDREERPDIDHIYMDAVQAMTGSGGWPLNVFLMPDGRPFFGGTYFPPVQAYNRSSWPQTLLAVKQAFVERRTEIESQAENLTKHIKSNNELSGNAGAQNISSTRESLNQLAQNALKQGDTQWGGFGSAPKFPQTFIITFLLRHYYFTADQRCLNHALLSLDKMIQGGIYDQLGGGFARYSTDEKWLAPHFEKMLYDNALLISVLSEAHQITKNELYATTIRQTVAWLRLEMMSEEGGFLSALDADSEGVEGKFYTWSKSEIDQLLGEDSDLYCKFYDISEEGNWEHTNILWITRPFLDFVNELADKERGGVQDLERTVKELIYRSNKKLLEVRSSRVRPGTDDKILLSWNALMITALCKAYAALNDEIFKELALKNMQFLEAKLKDFGSDGWFHTYKNGTAKVTAFLEDYAYLVQAYIHLQEITGQSAYLIKAKTLTQFVIQNFKEEAGPFFYFTHKNQGDVIVRKKEVYDGATPSGNSVMAVNLLYLAKIFDETGWFSLAEQMISRLEQPIIKHPTSFGIWASGLQWLTEPVSEIAIIGENLIDALKEVLGAYHPNKAIQASSTTDNNFPLLSQKIATDHLQIYLCRDYACLQPVSTAKELFQLISRK